MGREHWTSARSVLVCLLLSGATYAQDLTWCGKHYMANASASDPGGRFPLPATSSSPLLALRCAPAITPYLASDAANASALSPVAITVDARVTDVQVAGAQAITLPSGRGGELNVTVTLKDSGEVLASGDVPLNSTRNALPFNLTGLSPSTTPHAISCSATLGDQTFSSSGEILVLDDPADGTGSVTKLDSRTGALIARPKVGAEWERVFPIGFYTDFGGYLAKNVSVLDDLKAQGFTVVHPVPSFDDMNAFNAVLDRMEELGLYLMYDMRFTYMNDSSVTSQVNQIKSRPNLLLWYTGDEPDGTSDPLNATTHAQTLITSLDGARHPVSLVLNCQDFFFTEYAAGAAIVMEDTYMISNNASFSVEWGTPCNTTYGDCGCDNCRTADFGDITERLDQFAERLADLGREQGTAVWGVPQAFGGGEYWPRAPTGAEYVVQSILSINHGALGLVAWNDPTPADIKASASTLAKALPAMNAFLLSPAANYTLLSSVSPGPAKGTVDAALWSEGGKALLVAANTLYSDNTFDLGGVPGYKGGAVQQVLDSGAQADAGAGKVNFGSVGAGAWLLDVDG